MADLYGGQAVIEGVMMRGPHHFAVAARRASGEIALTCEPVPKILRPAWQKLPFLRGGFSLVDAMTLGTKSLFWAAKIAEEDTRIPVSSLDEVVPDSQIAPTEGVVAVKQPGGVSDTLIGGAMITGLVFAVFLFKILPQFGIEALKKTTSLHGYQLGMVDFVVRFSIFTIYILLIARMHHVYRVFQYHGAEHKAINALEAGKELTVANVREASRLHPRCGTSFLVIVIFLSVLAVAFFYDRPLWQRILIQLAMVFPVAGVAFELLRIAGKFRSNPIMAAFSRPGMWTQLLTTREPDDSQIEVSIASLNAAMAAESAVSGNASETQIG
ncbi:DUF1385 domain-containing protein [Armatimonas sp.]|uniref:DUF1385 domain-containing protein n=1 Tax=Armatimonas sp. TaxID=1872638 RepID=UPI00375275A1